MPRRPVHTGCKIREAMTSINLDTGRSPSADQHPGRPIAGLQQAENEHRSQTSMIRLPRDVPQTDRISPPSTLMFWPVM